MFFPDSRETTEVEMPTLVRFLTILGITGGVCFVIIAVMAYSIEPNPRDMSVTVPPGQLVLKPIATDDTPAAVRDNPNP